MLNKKSLIVLSIFLFLMLFVFFSTVIIFSTDDSSNYDNLSSYSGDLKVGENGFGSDGSDSDDVITFLPTSSTSGGGGSSGLGGSSENHVDSCLIDSDCESGYGCSSGICLISIPHCLVGIEIVSDCLCEETEHSSGYCCGFGWQEGACAIFEADVYVDYLTEDCIDYDVATRSCGVGNKIVFNTIQKGVNNLTKGKTLAVREGEYFEEVIIKSSWINGTRDEPILIRNYPGEHVLLYGLYENLSNWERCNPLSCLGLVDLDGNINSNYENIYKMSIDSENVYSASGVRIYEDRSKLNEAAFPGLDSNYTMDENGLKYFDSEGNILVHDILSINESMASIVIFDFDGVYSDWFKSGQKIVVSLSEDIIGEHYEFILDVDAIYNGDNTTTLIVTNASSFSNINSTDYGVENTRFYYDSDLNQSDGYWDGATIVYYTGCGANREVENSVASFKNGTVYFSSPLLRAVCHLRGGGDRYSFLNHPNSIEKIGDYVYVENDSYYDVYVWPRDNSDINSSMSVVKYANGIQIGENYYGDVVKDYGNYITIHGFEVAYFGGGLSFKTADWEGIVYSNNDIHDSGGLGVVRNGAAINNYLHNISGFGVSAFRSNFTISGNILEDVERTSIYSSGGKNMIIFNNTVEKGGTHANGIALYGGCENVLVANNYFNEPTDGLTLRSVRNLVIYNNIFVNTPIEQWVPGYNIYSFNNYVSSVPSDSKTTYSVAYNNIIYGSNGIGVQNESGNNIELKNIDASDLFFNSYKYSNSINKAEYGKIFDYGLNENCSAIYQRSVNLTDKIFPGDYIILNEDGVFRRVVDIKYENWYGNLNTIISFSPSVNLTSKRYQIWNTNDNSVVDMHHKEGGIGVDTGVDLMSVLPSFVKEGYFADFNWNQDFDGNSRPFGSAWDIGPYEYSGFETPVSGEVVSELENGFNFWEYLKKTWFF